MFLPVFEHLFHVTTDIRLLELSNQNLPLLRNLALEAPGTYQHSLMLGHLAEAAAESIGADALLARVSGYYHDIGKTRMPEYFIENQPKGANRHDRLEPSMSALIIAAHVKEGVEMAKRARLPEPIVAAIREHHGTKRIQYFYQKALTKADPDPAARPRDGLPALGAQALQPGHRHPDDRRRGRGGLAHAHRAHAGEDPGHDPDDRGRLPPRRPVRRVRPDDAGPRDHRRTRSSGPSRPFTTIGSTTPGFEFNRERARRRTGRRGPVATARRRRPVRGGLNVDVAVPCISGTAGAPAPVAGA